MSADDLDPIPPCVVCGHEHSAAWTAKRLTATGPCYCGCLIETRAELRPIDHGRTWIDFLGNEWEWSDMNGWVVNGMATVGGYDPDGCGPFTEVTFR